MREVGGLYVGVILEEVQLFKLELRPENLVEIGKLYLAVTNPESHVFRLRQAHRRWCGPRGGHLAPTFRARRPRLTAPATG